ncbi:MAG: UDP-N-acetylmuramoyl-tripeptide--D-alanyl-D-alanine ligase [Comamonadaceae bacterium]|nr:MAG: UDP-N-acetylmuramoyl-tripeptide--D-alanyl-D-alanine ligase [Comamonadaceae bacterium]
MMTLQQAMGWIDNATLVGDGATVIGRVHTDTRTLTAGDLFVALKGERFDANDFLAQAKVQGAVAALAHHGVQDAGLAGLEVADSRIALGQLAAGWRSQFTLPLVAVTGSNGKTTVTQMIASILRAWKHDAAFATEGNLNNDIGVPLTLLRLKNRHEAGVVELGMNHPGEIGYLANIARPTVALVNNAQREHLEFMQTVEAVARENGSVFASLQDGGTAVFPADDDYTPLWRELSAGHPVLTFAMADAAAAAVADVTATAQWAAGHWTVQAATPSGTLDFTLGIAGRHNVQNSLAATACALAAGAPLAAIAAGLSAFVPVKGRSRAFSVSFAGRDITVIDDTYNANPDSMRAAIDVLAELPAPRLLVMGDMGEVGDQGPQFHAEAGEHARARGIGQVFGLGAQTTLSIDSFNASQFTGGRHFDDIQPLIDAVIAELPVASSIVIKGSRFMKMERVVQAIAAHTPQQKNEEHHAA